MAKRVAPPAVYEVAPGLAKFTDEVLFGEVWLRPELNPRDRSLITLAALISTGKIPQVGGHTVRALDNGVRPEEIGEVITQMAFYSGWPNAVSAVEEVKKVYQVRRIGPVSDSAPPLEVDLSAEGERTRAVEGNVAPTAPALADLTNRVLFDQVWRRSQLSARDRSLVTVATLIALGQQAELEFHAQRALDNGLTAVELSEIPVHLAFYAGWPRAISAVPALRKVLAPSPSALEVIRPGTPSAGPEEHFTGKVQISTRYHGEVPARVGGATVSFAAGARTAWHAHPLGQTLYIVSGEGWVQKAGEPVQVVQPGDVVWIPPQIRHWHGASASQPMVHFAVAESVDGQAVTWMEKVSEEEYRLDPR